MELAIRGAAGGGSEAVLEVWSKVTEESFFVYLGMDAKKQVMNRGRGGALIQSRIPKSNTDKIPSRTAAQVDEIQMHETRLFRQARRCQHLKDRKRIANGSSIGETRMNEYEKFIRAALQTIHP